MDARALFGDPDDLRDHAAVNCTASALTVCSQSKFASEPSIGAGEHLTARDARYSDRSIAQGQPETCCGWRTLTTSLGGINGTE
jgi:hypothetical protein